MDYPVHTSSLSLANDGINFYNDNYYIRKAFDKRIPFEALLEPAEFLTNLEIHCSEPHPSGNISGSALWNGTGDTKEYQLMMHNFLSETANFFLKDQNFSFIASKKSDELSINLQSGSLYVLDISLYKTQNIASRAQLVGSSGEIVKRSSLMMTGSDVRENFTMYSRPSAFGPPNRVVGNGHSNIAVVTCSYSDIGFNWPFTPPYYDGISKLGLGYYATRDGRHTLEEVFNGFFSTQLRVLGIGERDGVDPNFSTYASGANYINDLLEIEKFTSFYGITKADLTSSSGDFAYGSVKDSCMQNKASINVSLGILKDVDLLDDDSSDTVKVAVDISSDTKSQIIIQPKWETPILNFQSYTDSDTISMPLIGSQSVPRGMWHQYGAIETDPSKGIFMQVTDPQTNTVLRGFSEALNVPMINLADTLGLDTSPTKLGNTAEKKVIREAIVAVPFFEYAPDASKADRQRVFFNLSQESIERSLNKDDPAGDPNISQMIEKMQRYVMPPMFNFVEDREIIPVTMYIFEFKHVLDQEDLAAIWQNLPPKIMTNFETRDPDTDLDAVTITHSLDANSLMNKAAITEQGGESNVFKKIRWLVFKVKQKAQQNYYDKVVGETKSLNKTSPYSHNWPYDFFSLVELAKIEASCGFTKGLVAPAEQRPTRTRRSVTVNVPPPTTLSRTNTASEVTTSRLPVVTSEEPTQELRVANRSNDLGQRISRINRPKDRRGNK